MLSWSFFEWMKQLDGDGDGGQREQRKYRDKRARSYLSWTMAAKVLAEFG